MSFSRAMALSTVVLADRTHTQHSTAHTTHSNTQTRDTTKRYTHNTHTIRTHTTTATSTAQTQHTQTGVGRGALEAVGLDDVDRQQGHGDEHAAGHCVATEHVSAYSRSRGSP